MALELIAGSVTPTLVVLVQDFMAPRAAWSLEQPVYGEPELPTDPASVPTCS